MLTENRQWWCRCRLFWQDAADRGTSNCKESCSHCISWPVAGHPPPGFTRCHSDWGPAAGGGWTVLTDDRNGGRFRLNASRQDDDRIYCRFFS